MSDMKGHYEDSGIDKKTMHAMKARKLASDVRCLFYKNTVLKRKACHGAVPVSSLASFPVF